MTGISKRRLMTSAALFAILAVTTAAQAEALRDQWCKDVHIRFFAGGVEGDGFANIVYNGARQAQKDTGAQVDFIFSGWSSEKMVQQLREAVASAPDGIAMMGHPGPDSIMPLAEEASKAGILMMYQNVDVPTVRAKFGGGYIGANLAPQGYALGVEAVRMSKIGKGDKAIVVADWSQENRVIRELGTVKALEDAGVTVIKLTTTPEMAGDPNLAIPVVSAGMLANPDVKLIAYPGGQMLGNAPAYMQASGKKPGEVFNIGFDTSAQIVDAFKNGWVQLTADQQPFLQGYLPILSLCQQKVYGLGAITLDLHQNFLH